MQRREFLKSGAIAGSTALLATAVTQATDADQNKKPFHLKYAPTLWHV